MLTSLGVLKSPQVICLEPTNHFFDEGSRPADKKLAYAYEDFAAWLSKNPPGAKGRNKQFLVAGYLEAIEDKTRNRITRMLPFESVPNTLNWPEWNSKIIDAIGQFPFPLQGNLIFSEAINWGLWNESIVNWLNQLVILQADYKWDKAMERNNDGLPQIQQGLSQKRKEKFYFKAKPLLQSLAQETANILTKVLGPQS